VRKVLDGYKTGLMLGGMITHLQYTEDIILLASMVHNKSITDNKESHD